MSDKGNIVITFSVNGDKTELRVETSGSLSLSKLLDSVVSTLPAILKTFSTPPIIDVDMSPHPPV